MPKEKLLFPLAGTGAEQYGLDPGNGFASFFLGKNKLLSRTSWVKAVVGLEGSLFCVWLLSVFQCNSFIRNRLFSPAVFLEIHVEAQSNALACSTQGRESGLVTHENRQ